jgi:tetratricopeptide (TPR) repeat protein
VIFVLGCVLSPSEDDEPWAESASEGRPAWFALILACLVATLGISVLLRPFLADIARKEVESTSNGLALDFDRESVEAGLRLEPLNGPLRFALAKEAYTRRDYPTAEREARLALEGINDVSLHSLLGIACLSEGKFDEARKHLNDAVTMSGGDPQILYYQALAATSAGAKLDAIRELEALVRTTAALSRPGSSSEISTPRPANSTRRCSVSSKRRRRSEKRESLVSPGADSARAWPYERGEGLRGEDLGAGAQQPASGSTETNPGW